jgi:hypothetical protein
MDNCWWTPHAWIGDLIQKDEPTLTEWTRLTSLPAPDYFPAMVFDLRVSRNYEFVRGPIEQTFSEVGRFKKPGLEFLQPRIDFGGASAHPWAYCPGFLPGLLLNL